MGLREMRLKADLQVKDVMRELGVSDAAVYYWETGANQPSANNLIRLANLYHCSIDDLIRETKDEQRN